MNKLLITAICVTQNNGNLIKYSIESIINYIDEILIFDDDDFNYNLEELIKYDNVKIIKKDLGKSLGVKKQYLNDLAKNDIILRWDNDFILYDVDTLNKIYNFFKNNLIDIAYGFNNLNLKFTLDKVCNISHYCKETYIFRKEHIKFDKYQHYDDYPILINNKSKSKKFEDEILFIHLNNFKSYENIFFRAKMNNYFNSNIDNYYEFIYNLNYPNKKYDYFDIIEFKKNSLIQRKNYIYQYNENFDKQYDLFTDISNLNINYNPSKLNNKLIDYILNNFKFIKINEKPDKYNYITQETFKLVNLYFFYDKSSLTNNFDNIISFYIFEKLSGYYHKYYDIHTNKENEYHYIISGNSIDYYNSKSILWGIGMNNNINPIINPKKIYCLRGKKTRNLLLKNNIDIPEVYGDPVLLLSKIYNKNTKKISNNKKIGIVVNDYIYNSIFDLYKNNKNLNIINLKVNLDYQNIETIIDEIISCEIILSYTLYGIIIANSYNIPAIRIKDELFFSENFQFSEYFESIYTDGYNCETLENINNIILNLDLIKNIYKTPDLIQKRQNDLIDSCPFIENSLKPLLKKLIDNNII